MANVEIFNVGAQQLLDLDLNWFVPYDREFVEPGAYALVMNDPRTGMSVEYVGQWSNVLWQLVRYLSTDKEHRRFVVTYEIWHIEDDGALWQRWECEVQRAAMQMAIPLPSELMA